MSIFALDRREIDWSFFSDNSVIANLARPVQITLLSTDCQNPLPTVVENKQTFGLFRRLFRGIRQLFQQFASQSLSLSEIFDRLPTLSTFFSSLLFKPAWLDETDTTIVRTGFADLPIDIHYLVREHLQIDAAAQLAMTNRAFWEFNKKYIPRGLRSLAGAWAGSRIITMYAEDGKISDELRQGLVAAGICKAEDVEGKFNVSSRRQLLEAKNKVGRSNEYKKYTTEQMEIFQACFKLPADEYWPRERKWILRNLTLKEYIRADVLGPRSDAICGPFVAQPGFGDILEFKTMFPRRRNDGEGCGEWAGHMFDVVALDIHEAEVNDIGETEEWTDQSQRVLGEYMDDWGTWSPPENWRRSWLREHERKLALDPEYVLHQAGGRRMREPNWSDTVAEGDEEQVENNGEQT